MKLICIEIVKIHSRSRFTLGSEKTVNQVDILLVTLLIVDKDRSLFN